MNNAPSFTRRRILELTSGATIVGLAGCTGTGAPSNDGGATESTSAESGQHNDETEHEETGNHDEETEQHEEESGHDDNHNDGEAIGEPTETAEVNMITADGGYHFEPHVVRVTVGGTVTFINESGSHSATAYHPDNDQPRLVPEGAASWDSGLLSESGATFEHTFETEGVYHYYCTPHETLGMIGSVIVGEPDAHDQPALEEPPADKPEAVQEKITELNAMCNEALGHTH